ncbi:hypothetical protein RJ639_006970 [Escallonia herrerae]|uniref:Glycosyltransferase n=1 Tax=Escallonia herrerae TaxID=1293975 RepID=A0AA88W4R5_9ASTE|nr:hypothetical protein RJ639_006970 [Escallonia herrerae]
MGSQRYEALSHVFLVSFLGQGHVNPLLRLGKLLASKGLLVTFSTPEAVGKQMRKVSNITDEPTWQHRFKFFEDGWGEDDSRRGDLDAYVPQLEREGNEVLPRMLKVHEDAGQPFSYLINNPFIPWVSDVADELGSHALGPVFSKQYPLRLRSA